MQPPQQLQQPQPMQMQQQQQFGGGILRAVGSTFSTAGDMLRTLVQPSRAYYMPVTTDEVEMAHTPRLYPASAPHMASYSDAAAPTYAAAVPAPAAPAPGSAAAYTYAVRV